MSVTTSNFQYPTLKWREKGDSNNLLMTNTEADNTLSTVDDGLTSLSWLQNLNMCMTRLGAPTPPTPPASPICFGLNCIQPPSNTWNESNSVPNSPVYSSTKCKAISSSGSIQQKGNSCNQASATTTRNGIRVQAEPKLQPTTAHKSENSKKKASPSHSKSVVSKQAKKGPQYNSTVSNCEQPQEEVVDYKSNGDIKPPYSYATLICMAMKANKNKMSLSSIYKWIKENFLYYRNADPSWQNSIRHNLSLNKSFIKVARNKDEPGKGGFWKLDPVCADSLEDGVFKKRRSNNKPNQIGNCTPSTNLEAKSTTKKKSRKKSFTTPKSNYIDGLKFQQDTPPNSAESYSYNKEKITDINESVAAVNSISNNCTYSYSLHSSNIGDCEQAGNLMHGYATEVCIANTANNECLIESDGNDICWNAILTEADLNELVDPITYNDTVGQIIQPIESEISNSISHSKTTTAQLTAVEPHNLDMVVTSSGMLEEQQLFYHANQLHSISFETNSGAVITATSNVVTCVNDGQMSGHWNGWPSYTSNGEVSVQCSRPTAELILSQIEHGQDQIMTEANVIINNSSVYITTETPVVTTTQETQLIHKHTPNSTTPNSIHPVSDNEIRSQSIETNSESLDNYEHSNSLQPWAECKAALEAAALDLESFGNMESIQQY